MMKGSPCEMKQVPFERHLGSLEGLVQCVTGSMTSLVFNTGDAHQPVDYELNPVSALRLNKWRAISFHPFLCFFFLILQPLLSPFISFLLFSIIPRNFLVLNYWNCPWVDPSGSGGS